VDAEALRQKLTAALAQKNALLEGYYHAKPLSFEEVYTTYAEYGRKLAPFIVDTARLVQDSLARGETVLLEGAQGALLDLDAGTYEYVTSSAPSSLAGGATVGIGIGPTQITKVIGVYKAYTTRVGNGPMPTELTDEMGEWLREEGSEYGATTGRPRRCGWFDAVASRYTVRLNGLTSAVLTRLDILDNLPSIQICTAYKLDGSTTDSFPASSLALARCQPQLEELAGWQCSTTNARRFEDLPKQAQAYVRRVEELLGCPIDIISVGPEREQAIVLSPPL
jgi:adenylosuccinate synthase